MKVYKVVQENDGKLCSTVARGKHCRRYAIGKKTLPIPGTKLFAFTTLQAAIDYSLTGKERVFEAEAEIIGPIEYKAWLTWFISDRQFLKKIFATRNWSRVQKNAQFTVLCDSITLIKKVK